MDEYGYAAAAKVGIRMFDITSRRTGRTSRMIERATDEDQIVAPTREVANYIRQRLRDAGKKCTVFVSEPGDVPMRRVGTAPRGRTFFDHSWVERHFALAVEHAERDLEAFQRETSKTWPEKPPKPDSTAAYMYEYSVRNV